MIKVRQISHATFETPDLDAQIEHYAKVTGLVVAAREKDRALLTSKVGQLVVQLRRGERARCAKLAFQVTPNSDFGEMSRFLTTQGIKNEERSDDIPGMPKLLAFEDIKGTTIELLSEWRHLTPSQSTAGVSPFKLRSKSSGQWLSVALVDERGKQAKKSDIEMVIDPAFTKPRRART